MLKKLCNFILILFSLLCGGVLVCAFNPVLTDTLAQKVAAMQEGHVEDAQYPSGGTTQNPEDTDILNSVSEQSLDENSYVIPQRNDIVTPQSVQDRTGYEPIHEEGELIGDEDAKLLRDDLTTVEVEEQYDFDALFYPYYAMLDDVEKALYRLIYTNVLAGKETFSPVVDLSVSEVKEVFEAVYNDHPELFWLETGYYCKYQRNGRCVEITLRYHEVANNLSEAKNTFDSAAESVLSAARKLGSDYEKEKYVHDALVNLINYNENADMTQSAYGALVNHKTVCAGYARAFQYLLRELKIPCYYCTGYSNENHAWNVVKLEDAYYNVDVTWDDTDPSTYDFFNKTDADYAKTHMRTGLSVKLPACYGTKYGDGSQSDGQDAESLEEDDLINDDPQKPLSWVETPKEGEKTIVTDPAREEKLKILGSLGLKEEDILDTMEKYYADCLKQMTEVGTGQKQFVNVIPNTLWATLEQSYGAKDYLKGYVEEALKKLGVENFSIQLQGERLNGGYYRLYHNIDTW